MRSCAAMAMRTRSKVARGRAGSSSSSPARARSGRGWDGSCSAANPVFAARLRACAAAFEPYLDFSLLDLLDGSPGAPPLERVDVVQPALFAVMVSLARLWESLASDPTAVVGHSQGEIAAAHVAGAISLADAARVVALRSRAIADSLAGAGGMVSVFDGAEAVAERIEPWGSRLALAAMNGPAATVVSGEPVALQEFLAACEGAAIRARAIPVDYASHSARVEAIRDRVLAELAAVEPVASKVPFYSALAGAKLDGAELDAEYWYRSLREPVRFEAATRALIADGFPLFIEASPHPVLSIAIEETAEQVGGGAAVTAIGSLRREEPEPERFTRSLAEAHVVGAEVDWPGLFVGARRVDLPTYAFQRQRFWLESRAGHDDLSGAGLAGAEHPLLRAAVAPAGREERIFTGKLSLDTQPWLADHAVAGEAILPGTACLEMALWAGRELGVEVVEELVQEVPLLLPSQGSVQIQLAIEAPDPDGLRRLTLHSRREAGANEGDWTRNVVGTLGPGPVEPAVPPLDAAPPAGAEPLEVESLYGRLAAAGFEYGPAFQGLSAAWQSGEEVFAEARLDDLGGAAGFEIHPALLDAVLHANFIAAASGEQLPFAWSGARLHGAAGDGPLRARLGRAGDGLSLLVCDAVGLPVLSVDRLDLRPLDRELLRRSTRSAADSLFRLAWEEVALPLGGDGEEAAEVELLQLDTEPGDDPPSAAQALAVRALGDVREWLDRDDEGEARLALLTTGALAAGEGESADPALAAVWGLLQSGQSEHPEQLLLVDSDDSEASRRVLQRALRLVDEPRLAIRKGRVLAPRLRRATLAVAPERPFDPGATTLITGGAGTLGAIVARHLVAEHGARHLLLASRRGAEAPGALELKAELEELGTEVELAACDVSSRAQLAALIASVPSEVPLRNAIHAAGVLDDCLLEALTPERLEAVMRPKARAAWNLHELTAELELSQFVLFSSIAATLGNPGQAAYAAANAFMESLAAARRAVGLPATAIAWGRWESESELTAELGEADRERLRRAGTGAIADAEGALLFDAAMRCPEPLVIASPIDLGSLRLQANEGTLAPLFLGLLPAGSRRAASGAARLGLAGLNEEERREALLSLVRREAAVVIGRGEGDAIEPATVFSELGFDSLMAVELRNRLGAALGRRLPASTIFDHPTPLALAEFLAAQMKRGDSFAPVSAELDELEVPARRRRRGGEGADPGTAPCSADQSVGWSRAGRRGGERSRGPGGSLRRGGDQADRGGIRIGLISSARAGTRRPAARRRSSQISAGRGDHRRSPGSTV